MVEEQKTMEDLAKDFVESISTISDKKIETALNDRDIVLKQVIKNTEDKSMEVAKKIAKDEVDYLKKDMFITFGIFTSFIAFIVGEINILKTIDSIYDKLGFSFLFVSFILGFLFGVMFLFEDEKFNGKFKKMLYVFSVFFVIGIFFILLPYIFRENFYYMIIK